jgi:hypothetical protein
MKYVKQSLIEAPCEDEWDPPGSRLCSGGGGQKSGGDSTTTIQKSDPWAGQQPYLETGYQWAKQAAQQTPTTPYSGQLIAPVTGQQQSLNQAQLGLGGQIGAQGQPLVQAGNQALGALGSRIGPAPVTSDISQNPYATNAIQAAINPVMRSFREQVLPGIGSEAVRSGAWGGTDHLRAQILAGERATQQAQDAASRLALPLYQSERGIETDLQKSADALNMAMAAKELQLAPTLTQQGQQTQLQGLGLQQQAAGQERAWNQEGLDEQMARYQMAMEAPWNAVNPYMRLIAGFDPGGVTTTTAPAASRGSVAQGALGGALAGGLGGYGAASMLGLPLTMAGGGLPLLIGGGLLGGLAGGFF